MSHGKYKVVKSRTIHKNPYYSVRHEDIVRVDGEPGEFFVMDQDDTVIVMAQTDEKKFLMVKLFRYTIGQESIEFPAGGTDGEEPLQAAKRELQEETGYVAGQWTYIGRQYGGTGVADHAFHILLATQLEPTDTHEKDEEGITDVIEASCREIDQMILRGDLYDMECVSAYAMTKLFMDQNGL